MIERVVVETDDADEQTLAAAVLEKRGCTVTETSDGTLPCWCRIAGMPKSKSPRR